MTADILSERRLDIQGMRALAVFVVVAYHAGAGFSGGYVGVDVFFVISGYVITRLLMRELGTASSISFRRFYLRRIKRLLPPLAVMLVVVLPASVLLVAHGAQRVTAGTGFAAAVFSANTYLAFFGLRGGYFGLGSDANPLLHTWSLSVEEQFYLGFPAMLLGLSLVARRWRWRKASFIGLVALAGLSFALSIALRRGYVPAGSASSMAFYFALARAWEFAVGALVVELASTRSRLLSALRPVLAPLGLVLTAVAVFSFDDATVFPDFAVLLPVLGTAFMIIGGEQVEQGVMSRWLGVAPLRFLGDISYSWYLWHWPLIVFADAMWQGSSVAKPLAAVLALGPACLSYRWVENPLRLTSRWAPRRVLALGMACVLLPVGAAVVLRIGERVLAFSSSVEDFGPHADAASGCDNSTPLSERDSDLCRWQSPGSRGEVLLVGDSNAGQFSEAVLVAGGTSSLDVRIATFSGCPFVPMTVWRDGEELTACRQFVDGTIAAIVDARPSYVVLASAVDDYIESSDWSFDSDGARLTDPADKAVAWESALRSMLVEFRDVGVIAVVVHPAPKFPKWWQPRSAAPLRLILDADGYAFNRDRRAAIQWRYAALRAEQQAVEFVGARTVDPFEFLCPRNPCATRSDATWLYRDGGHITVAASVALAEVFALALAEM